MNLKISFYSASSVSNTAPSTQQPPSPTQHPILDRLPPQDELENNLLLHSLRLQHNATPQAPSPRWT
eukprot:1360372-Pyramimonas_sp.AAC.1